MVLPLSCGSWPQYTFHPGSRFAFGKDLARHHQPEKEVWFGYGSNWKREVHTISALINHINLYRKTRIITLEDPVEFLLKVRHRWFPKGRSVRMFPLLPEDEAPWGKPRCHFRWGNP